MKIIEKIRNLDLPGAFLFIVIVLMICFCLMALEVETQREAILKLSERIDSINAPCEQFNRNIDSTLYQIYGPNCPICGHKFEHYNKE